MRRNTLAPGDLQNQIQNTSLIPEFGSLQLSFKVLQQGAKVLTDVRVLKEYEKYEDYKINKKAQTTSCSVQKISAKLDQDAAALEAVRVQFKTCQSQMT